MDHLEKVGNNGLNRLIWNSLEDYNKLWANPEYVESYIRASNWASGASGTVTTLYGDEAQSFFSKLVGILYGSVTSGTTEGELTRNGYIIDANDGTSIAYHRNIQKDPNDITSLERQDAITLNNPIFNIVDLNFGPNTLQIHNDAAALSTRSNGSRDWAGYAGYSWQMIKANDFTAGNGSLAYYRGTPNASGSKSLQELRTSAKANSSLFRQLFGTNEVGAQAVLSNIDNVKIPGG